MLELFPGPLRQYAEAVAAGPPAPADIAIAALGSSPAGPLARALQLSAAHHGSIDSRVTGSVWARHGFSSLLPGVVAAAALAHHVLPLRDAAIRADRRGRAVTLLLPHGGEALHRAPPHQRYGPLLDDLLGRRWCRRSPRPAARRRGCCGPMPVPSSPRCSATRPPRCSRACRPPRRRWRKMPRG
ncbi:hypothetical protein [Cupriavidus sp. L7L]|uniref:hypothetical protein n=1 Tax=Cupriavidus sp. L7L TaxID=2546443 RepID=UPI001FB5A77A|nr:hypothetical protein [Cupriavidus sp. L7L]